MCFVWIREQTAIISIHSFKQMVFVTEMECVYSAIRTEYWSVIHIDHNWLNFSVLAHNLYPWMYRGADKSLARPRRKQANISVRMAWISFGALPCRGKRKETWWQLASRCCWNHVRPWHASEHVSFLVRLRTYQHPGGDTPLHAV